MFSWNKYTLRFVAWTYLIQNKGIGVLYFIKALCFIHMIFPDIFHNKLRISFLSSPIFT